MLSAECNTKMCSELQVILVWTQKLNLSWLYVLQSAAQQAQEDAAVEGQVRGEMWGNLQGILAMLAGQGCNPLVQDMIHQIAVHFANEQSQSVAAERRLAGNLVKEKEARGQMQQQLHGGIQVNHIKHTSAYTAQTDITVSML